MNTTTQQDTQAAANKAAEEGGLPVIATWQERSWSHNPTDPDEHVPQLLAEIKDLRAAIAADRASRQVANKAEVEQLRDSLAWHKKALAAIDGKLASVWAGVSESVAKYSGQPCAGEPFDRLDELLKRLTLATHPATTGASTAKSIDTPVFTAVLERYLEDGDDAALIRFIDRYFAGSVGASTVLTDERIKELWLAMNTCDYKDFARAIEREVVAQAGHSNLLLGQRNQTLDELQRAHEEIKRLKAQAGQVAVPDTCTLPPEGWYCTRPAGHDGPCAAWPCDQKVEYLAAPSPAKESK